MDRTVEGYLAELRKHLTGADPALVQDAIYDADEYLRSALAESQGDPEAFDAAIEAYGAPEEVAAAYRDAEHTVTKALRGPKPVTPRSDNPLARFFGVIADPQAWGALFYLLLALVTGVMYFTIVVTGISVTLGTLVLIVGVPIALLTLAVVRAISLAEGRIVEGLLGVRMPRRPRTVVGPQGTIWDRIKSWLTDSRTWTTMLYMILQLPLGITYFSIMVASIATSAALVAVPFGQMVSDGPLFRSGAYGYYVEPYSYPLWVAAGLVGFIITLWIAKGIGFLHGQYSKVMLVGRTGAEGLE